MGNKEPLQNKVSQITKRFPNVEKLDSNFKDAITINLNDIHNPEEAFILLDTNLTIISFSNQALILYKKYMQKELLIGSSILNFALPGHEEQLKEHYQSVLKGKYIAYNINFTDAENLEHIYELTYCAGKDNSDNLTGIFISAKNITNQKKEEAALIKNEAKWHNLIENIYEIFIILNVKSCIEYSSDSLQSLLGYSEDKLQNKKFYEFFEATDKKIMKEAFKKALAHPGLKMQQKSIKIQHKSGKWIWVESSLTYLIDDYKHQSVIYTARDITRFVESFSILEIENANKKALVNATEDLVWSLNESYEWITGNNAFIKMLKEFGGLDFKPGDKLLPSEKFTQEWLSMWEVIYKKAFSGESVRQEIFIPFHAEGKEGTWSEVSCNPIWENNKVVSVACISRDITERRKKVEMEKELALNRSLSSAIINNSEDAIVSKLLDGTITSWNKGAEKMFGYSTEEIIGKSVYLLIPKELREEEIYIINKIKNKEPVEHYETERIDKLGNKLMVSITVSPVLNHEGNVVGASKIARDITRQKADAIAIQKNEARLQGIINSQTNYVIRTDLEGKYTYYNEKFYADFGWLCNKETLIGVSGMESIMPYHHQRVSETVYNCIKEPNKVFQVEIDKPFSNESIKTTFWDFICLTDFMGNPAEIQCVGIDITNRVVAEKQLEESLEEKNSILESIGDAFFTIDKNWITTYWNSNAALMLGIPKEKIIGKNIVDFFQKEDIPVNFENFKKAINTNEKNHYETYYPATERWYEVNAYPSAKGLSVYFKDVTEKKKLTDLIVEANERYNLASLATNDVIWDYNVVTRTVERAAENMKRVFGYDKSYGINSIDFWKKNIHPGDVERINNQFDAVFKNIDEPFMESEYRFKKADGSYAYVYDKGYIIRNAAGLPQRMIGAVQDVSWLKEKELQLQKKSEQLFLSNKELEQFAFVASHDLQEPLRMVTGFLTQLKKNYEGDLDERAKTYIKFAVDGAVRMRQIILDVLDYSRVGKLKRKMEEVDFNEVVKEIIFLAQKKIEDTNANIVYDKLPVIFTYHHPVLQLLQNLIMNALKFSKPGISPVIEIGATEAATEWIIEVKDNGIGIDKEYYDKVFVLFQRLNNREDYEGTGIGLSLAKKIVENLGGSIWVESTEGEGSTFYFTIKKDFEKIKN